MSRRDASVEPGTSGADAAGVSETAERLLGCSTLPLPPLSLGRLDVDERIEHLLERMVGVAGAGNGVVVLADAEGRLVERATVGLEAGETRSVPAGVDDLQFGLIVHPAEIHGDGRDASAEWCDHGLLSTDARMAICLPLEVGGRVLGAVQLGFQSLKSLQPAEIRRLGMIADHIASAAEAGRLARESASRLAEVQRVSAVLDEIDRMKGDFLAMISHELRTPLTAIIGYTDLLMRQVHGSLTDRQLHHQQAVRKAAHRLLALVNDLLDLNRLESGHASLSMETVSLLDAVRRAVEQVDGVAEQRGVELREDVPIHQIVVLADPERLHQILVNLLENAVKFTPAQGSVTVRVNRRDGQADVSVVDTGVGVPADQIDRIWDRFHQADSSTRRHFGGTGLGLAIVRHLVELHGGSVAVASDGPGRGSTFSFSLPVADGVPSAAADSPSSPAELAGQAGQPVTSRTVLIVDDEPDNREVITSIVQEVLGHTVLTAANGHEALARAQDGPDLVLLDLRMPGMSGFEVARELKRQPATAPIPIIAITALDDEDDRLDAMAAGCIGCVTKPFSEDALATAVSIALSTSAGEGAG
jgi:signal transduction histidine kinase/ActR/RegA family two-component response regulator